MVLLLVVLVVWCSMLPSLFVRLFFLLRYLRYLFLHGIALGASAKGPSETDTGLVEGGKGAGVQTSSAPPQLAFLFLPGWEGMRRRAVPF